MTQNSKGGISAKGGGMFALFSCNRRPLSNAAIGFALTAVLLLLPQSPAAQTVAVSLAAETMAVERVEALSATDRAAATKEADALKAALLDRIATERGFAEEAARFESEYRSLAGNASEMAAESERRAAAYDRDSRDPLLSDSFRERLGREAESQRASAAGDRARAEERERIASGHRAEAEKHFDKIAALEDLIARLDAAVATADGPVENPPAAPASATAGAETDGDGGDDGPLEFLLADVLGMWRTSGDDGFAIAIVQQDPDFEAYPFKLEAHTLNRIWDGNYTSFPAGNPARSQNARLQFTYTPRADEINPEEIPEWVGREVAGQVIWRLEMDEVGTLFEPRLSVKWFRGEIRWTEGEGTERRAWVEGDGVPRVFELEPQDGIQLDELSAPTLGIKLAAVPDHDPLSQPIQALLKGQQFFIRVTLPAEVARDQGNTLTVELKGLSGGSDDTIELIGTAPAGLRPVVYSHTEAVAIADCDTFANKRREPQFMSLNWIFGATGDCLSLDIDNGETVEVRYGDAYQQVEIYNSWVQRGLVRHAQALERLNLIFGSILVGPYDHATKEKAHSRQRMLANYRQLMDSDKLTDLHRYALGELYLGDNSGPGTLVFASAGEGPGVPRDAGLVVLTDAQIIALHQAAQRWPAPVNTEPDWFNPLMQAFLEGVSDKDLTPDAYTAGAGMVWTSEAERYFVENTLRRMSGEILGRAMRESVENLAFGLYDGYVTATGAGGLYLVVTGKDHFGHRVPKWYRLVTALGLASNAVLTVGPGAVNAFMRPTVGRSRLGRAVARQVTIIADGGVVRRLEGIVDLPDTPRSLAGGQRQQTVLRFADSADEVADAVSCGRPRRAQRPRATIRSEAPPAELDFADADDYVRSAYGPKAEILDPFGDELLEIQVGPSCNTNAANYIVWKKTGRKMTQEEAQSIVDEIMIDQLFETPGAGSRRRTLDDLMNGPGVVEGVDQFAIRDYLRHFGAKVSEIDHELNRFIKLRHIWSALEKGYAVKAIIELGPSFGPQAYHAVVVDGLWVSKSGKVIGVRIYDSNVGKLIRVPARRFNELLARDIDGYGILTLIEF